MGPINIHAGGLFCMSQKRDKHARQSIGDRFSFTQYVRERRASKIKRNEVPLTSLEVRQGDIDFAPSMYSASLVSRDSFERPNVVLTASSVFSLDTNNSCEQQSKRGRKDQQGNPFHVPSSPMEMRKPPPEKRFVPSKPPPKAPPKPVHQASTQSLRRYSSFASSIFSVQTYAFDTRPLLQKIRRKVGLKSPKSND